MIRTTPKAPKKLPPAPASYNASKSPAAQAIVEAMAASLKAIRNKPRKRGRPPSGKIMVNLRLDPDVVAKFKATGPGWQARINDVLKAAKL